VCVCVSGNEGFNDERTPELICFLIYFSLVILNYVFNNKQPPL